MVLAGLSFDFFRKIKEEQREVFGKTKDFEKMGIKREEPTTTAIAAGDYEKNLSECHI